MIAFLFSPLGKIASGAIIVVIIGLVVFGWLESRSAKDVQKGIDKQVAADIAQANQNVAERRVTDAQFDKHDAADVCHDFGLEWVFIDGKSQCR